MAASADPVIKAHKLVKRFGSFTAVDAIDLSVMPGQCFGLLGPNGAGKSTTVKMITGLSPITGGTLEVFGLSIVTDARRIKAHLGVVAQDDNLDPELTVLENLIVYAGYFGIPKKEARQRAEELLSFMELEGKAGTKVDHLSGGMKRRLTIARALINKPKIIILDEPTTGLDPHARHIVWQKIRQLKENGTTVLLTTHYLEEASQLCDRLVFMHNGKIIDEGQPAALVSAHIGSHVLELAGGDFTAICRRLPGTNLINGFKLFGDTLYIYSNHGPQLQEWIKGLSIDFSYQLLRPATLEDVFLKLTGRSLEDDQVPSLEEKEDIPCA
ncbi:ABC transporter [Thermincola ferriacetica]|uniref:ABC transporter n=1 Tax=Thermincola ferriacetica TaxID=281456 RepID=A0A0L6W1L8_9FIRM|nr:ATP-binding cassette domain-containing protein [Thermincola ferriacetica]KNZ69376.1 ABC transporter [Thermincola ferriacetica]